MSPALQVDFLPSESPGKPRKNGRDDLICKADIENNHMDTKGGGGWEGLRLTGIYTIDTYICRLAYIYTLYIEIEIDIYIYIYILLILCIK